MPYDLLGMKTDTGDNFDIVNTCYKLYYPFSSKLIEFEMHNFNQNQNSLGLQLTVKQYGFCAIIQTVGVESKSLFYKDMILIPNLLYSVNTNYIYYHPLSPTLL